MAETLSDDELRKLVMALANGMKKTGGRDGKGGFNETDGEIIEKWAHDIRLGQIMLDLVLAGEVWLAVKNGEVVLHAKPE